MENQKLEINFSNFIMGFATAALVSMGIVEDPVVKKMNKQLAQARQHIDTLEMLKGKTNNNLTSEESTLLNNIIADLKMKFVQVEKEG